MSDKKIDKSKFYPLKISYDNNISLSDMLDYEIRSSWLVSWIGWNWGEDLAVKYFIWKTKIKFKRYTMSKTWERQMNNLW